MKVTSSLIKEIDYNSDLKTLVVIFNSNDLKYKYYDISKDLYNSFIESKSIGSYFLKNIKNKFKFKKYEKF